MNLHLGILHCHVFVSLVIASCLSLTVPTLDGDGHSLGQLCMVHSSVGANTLKEHDYKCSAYESI